jgi:hypothetical protein
VSPVTVWAVRDFGITHPAQRLRGLLMMTMRCPSCGEPVELGADGVTFKHVIHADGQSSTMFHDGTLVHQCDQETARVWQGRDGAGSAAEKRDIRI